MTDIKTPVAAILFFKIFQDFVMRNIFCKFEISTYNTLALSRINVPGSHHVFQSEAKNIPRQDFMVMNISRKFEKARYNIFFLLER